MDLKDATVLGATVRRLRTQAEVTQTRLAGLANISVGHLSRFEQGERAVSAATYARLIDALHEIAREQLSSVAS